jgi:hypothetical protein
MIQTYVQRMSQLFASETFLTPQSRLVALDSVVEAAVNAEVLPEATTTETTDKLRLFVSCLKDNSMKERYSSKICIS